MRYEDLAGEPQSCWTATAPMPEWPPLPAQGETVDVCIIGGGLVGITAAVMLKRAGRRVAVVEARRIGRQVTGGSTAKVTTQHSVIYTDLVRDFGDDGARAYADANQAGQRWIAEQVAALGIACDWADKDAYVWCGDPGRVDILRDEAGMAARLGLPASFVPTLDLPVPVAGALRFTGQAQFHPVKYLLGLAEELRNGAHVFEDTRVLDVDEGAPCRITTDRGVVTAAEVVVATNLPILDRGGFFARAIPYRHVAIAAPIPEPLAGMYISLDAPTRSLRTTPSPQGPLLIAVGEAFKTGHADTLEKFAELEAWVRAHFAIGALAYRWGNQDYYSADRVPYVGRLHPMSRHVRVATGFNAWGFTNGTAAAMILTDGIIGRANPWAELYDAQRVKGAVKLVKENLAVAAEWMKDRLAGKATMGIEQLPAGEGAVVRTDKGEAAAYRAVDGTLHLLSPTCTHMGCTVTWNAGEQSWDCPCHGSRFAIDGTVLSGPAVRGLERRT